MIQNYLTEISYRSIYIIYSIIFCFFISFQNIELLLLVETYPFLKFSDKKFIVTHTTDLINITWYITFSTSYFATLPFLIYQLIQFFKSSWYNYQILFAQKLVAIPLVFCYIVTLLCYLKIFPLILNFLVNWNFNQLGFFLNIEIEFRIISYLNWILSLRYFFGFISYFFVMLVIQFIFLISIKDIYNIVKFNRKKLCFLNILILFILTPPDILLQFFIIFISFTFYETIFFIICYKICSIKL